LYFFETQILDDNWSSTQIRAIAEACVISGKNSLFSELFKKRKYQIFEIFSLDLSKLPVSYPFFSHVIKCLSQDEFVYFSRFSTVTRFFKYFVSMINEHYDIIAFTEILISDQVYILTTSVAKIGHCGSEIPGIVLDFQYHHRLCLDNYLREVYVDQLFKSAESLTLLAPQIISWNYIKMISEIEDAELGVFLYSEFVFDTHDTVAVFDNATEEELELLKNVVYDYYAILIRLSTRVHFEKFEQLIQSDLASYLIPIINGMTNANYDSYSRLRLALNYIKRRYTARICEIEQTFILDLFTKEQQKQMH
jgi:hypothetical protein